MVTDPEHVALDLSGVDQALLEWRQGDCVVGSHWFVFRADKSLAVTVEAQQAAEAESDLVETAVEGLVVLSQTCEIVRSCEKRPFIEICPLVKVPADQVGQIARGRLPAYALIPSLADQGLVAHLDRIMTVEKPVVARWKRVIGCSSDQDRRRFAVSLARKRSRFAFPNDFELLAGDLKERLDDKHDKNSPEGRALRALLEIRVAAAPTWDAPSVALMFWFVRDPSTEGPDSVGWDVYLERWLNLLPAGGRFPEIEGVVTSLDGMTAADYVSSVPLDLDRLSLGAAS